MQVYSTEEEQVEAIKKWWQENGTAILFGLIVGLGGLFGWRMYDASVTRTQTESSQNFTQLMAHMAESKYDSATAVAEQLVELDPEGAYALLARFNLASIAVDEGRLQAASDYLQQIVDLSDSPAIKSTARLRLAQVYLADGKADQAWSELQSLEPAADPIGYLHLKGDVLAARGDNEAARAAYNEALGKEVASASGLAEVLELKIDSLGAAGKTL